MDSNSSESDILDIEKWKTKKTIKSISNLTGMSNTSMITLAIPPSKSINQVASMLVGEYGTASNIKSRVNKLSVLSAITSTQQRLKKYNTTPKNGLVIYCGSVQLEGSGGKDKKITIDIVPFKPIGKFMYLCDNRFHTDVFDSILEDNDRYGFIIMDGGGALFAQVYGNEKNILHRFTVDLPPKHRKGGQSALRFSRLQEEARNNFVRKTAEFAVSHFIDNDVPSIKGLIIAGFADFKSVLMKSPYFDPRLKKIVLQLVVISYGGLNGLSQAIELSAETLSNVKLLQEKKILDAYFHEIQMDTGKYCFGIEHTMEALEQGAAEKLIIWEESPLLRCVMINSDGEEEIHYYDPSKNKNKNKDNNNQIIIIDKKTQNPMDLKESCDWTDWIAENYTNFGTCLEFVSDRTTQGTQYVKGFGGIGCIMRWSITFTDDMEDLFNNDMDNDYDEDEDEFDMDISDFL